MMAAFAEDALRHHYLYHRGFEIRLRFGPPHPPADALARARADIAAGVGRPCVVVPSGRRPWPIGRHPMRWRAAVEGSSSRPWFVMREPRGRQEIAQIALDAGGSYRRFATRAAAQRAADALNAAA